MRRALPAAEPMSNNRRQGRRFWRAPETRAMGNLPAENRSTGFGVIHFFQQFLQKFGALIRAQFALQLFQRQGYHVIVVSTSELRVGGNVEPKSVHELDILRAHPWCVRSKREFTNGSVRSANFQSQARTWLRQTFPSIAGELGLLVGREFVGESANHA